MRAHSRVLRSRAGATLTELMVAAVIMSVGIVGFFGAFRFISRSLYVSRAQSLATNLAQERVESLKNLNYYGLLITTSTASDVRFTPNIVYDNANYPPETIYIQGITYTRYTYVTMADMSGGGITQVAYNYPDTGLKEIVVNIVWSDNGSMKKWTLTNVLENPYVNPLDATIQGQVTISGGGALPGAKVRTEQNAGFNAASDASGNYQFKVYHGSYTVRASSAGFYDAVSPTLSVSRNGVGTANLALQRISTGTVSGIVWYNNDLVISQVVADTYTQGGDGNRHDIEYFELFNPTTFPINIGTTGTTWANKPTTFILSDSTGSYTYDIPTTQWPTWPHGLDVVNVSSYVPPGRYYLIANATSFFIAGNWINADAYYSAGSLYTKVITTGTAEGISLYHPQSGTFADMVGWQNHNGSLYPGYYEWPVIPNVPSEDGLGVPAGKQIVRVSSPAASAADMTAYGSAYDSNGNQNDFVYPTAVNSGIVYPPHNLASGAFNVLAGKVPSGVVVSANDPNSNSVTATQVYKSSGALSLPYVPFTLTGVTTGTWTVAMTYGNYAQVITNVNVTQNQSTGIYNGGTTPAALGAGLSHVELSSLAASGFIKGTITDPNNNPISGITVQAGGVTKLTGSTGQYFMAVSSGSITVIANPNNGNASYIQTQAPVVVSQGATTTQNFVLSQGGVITGYCTTGTTPVPNMVVGAVQGGSQMGSGTSDATGTFNIKNISTGTYTVAPVLDIGQDSSPNSVSTTLTSVGTVFAGTFTVVGAYGSITGTVTNSSALVTSGALVIASTQAISSTPPAIAASSSPANVPYYMISSKADGTYSLPVRGSSTYYLSVYVPVVSNLGTVSITTKTYSGIIVSVSGTTTQNVVLP